jgi:hypothetical protein
MDHVSVREGYRLWHGVSHVDDARQAPPNTQHFDGAWMGPDTDSPFQAGQHIPGLNVGGWYDAGDYDIRAESQYAVIEDLALAYKEFDLKWDELAVDETASTVEMHRPDGVPDAVQQIKHGVLQVLGQIKSIGHQVPEIMEPNLREYTHLGDAASKTDGRIYSSKLGPHEVQGDLSGVPDDRWAFTTKEPRLQYGAAAALAARHRLSKGGMMLSPGRVWKLQSGCGKRNMIIRPPSKLSQGRVFLRISPKKSSATRSGKLRCSY